MERERERGRERETDRQTDRHRQRQTDRQKDRWWQRLGEEERNSRKSVSHDHAAPFIFPALIRICPLCPRLCCALERAIRIPPTYRTTPVQENHPIPALAQCAVPCASQSDRVRAWFGFAQVWLELRWVDVGAEWRQAATFAGQHPRTVTPVRAKQSGRIHGSP